MAVENTGIGMYVGMLLAGGAVLVIICFLTVVHHWYWRDSNAVLMAWPVVGMLPALLHHVQRLHDFLTEVLKKSGGTFQFKGPWFGDLDFVITCDPLNIQHVLNSNFANYPKGEEFREVFDVLGDGILNVDSDLWRLQRKMYQLWTTRHNNFVSFIARTIQRKMVDELIPFLDQVSETGLQVDLQEAFMRMITFDNAILLIFGFDPAYHSFKRSKVEYQKAFEDIHEALLQRHYLPQSLWKFLRWSQIGGERKLRKGVEILNEFLFQCISVKQEELSDNKGKSSDQKEADLGMLTVYMEEKEHPYSLKFLKDVAVNFLVASKDTLTSSLTWFFWLVATHSSVKTKILEEMKEVLPAKLDQCSSFGVEELNKLIYLQAALCETFRLYPPVPFNHKTANKEDILPSGHPVKQKERVLLSFYSMGRMEEIWGKDCLEFKPERWISKQGGLVYVPSQKYPVFNAGPRTCLGKEVVFIQMKVVAITVLRNYNLEVVEGNAISPTLTITLHMKHGLKVRFSKTCP